MFGNQSKGLAPDWLKGARSGELHRLFIASTNLNR
jgi:hypothetical protein